MTGIEVAKQLKVWYPKVNIVFVTGYDKYMAQAIELRMSGYVTKPATKEKILIELEDLKHPVTPPKNTKVLTARCFGNFEVFVNGKILEFEKAKTKEMLAYLIDRRGSSVTSGELRSVLWENEMISDTNTRSYLSKIKRDLVTTLKKAGVKDAFIEAWGKYAIDPGKSAVIIMTFWMISRKASGHIMGNICRSTVGENLIGLQVNKNRKSAVYQVRCLLYCGSFYMEFSKIFKKLKIPCKSNV